MKKISLMSIGVALVLIGTSSIATTLEDLGEITLIDETHKSTLKQTGPIVGCNDLAKENELSCSKKPEEVILSKLPTSSQLDEKDLDNDDNIEEIKSQLVTILKEISMLKKQREKDKIENQKIQQRLNSLIGVISDKKTDNAKNKLTVVKSGIEKLIKENSHKKITRTYISKKIKVIEKTDDHIIVEVQQGESLSTYAQAYYGDNTKYYRIYKANRDKIAKDLQVIIGSRLTIPLR